MLLEVTITACLIAAPAKCQDVRLNVLDAGMTITQCQMSPAVYADIAAWRQRNPEFEIRGWRCHPMEKDA